MTPIARSSSLSSACSAPCSTISSSSAAVRPFIATKLEAFRGRGGGQFFASHDLEDIVTLVDGRPEIVAEVGGADSEVRAYIASEVRSLLDNPDFAEALPGFLLPDAASQARRGLVEERLRALSASADR